MDIIGSFGALVSEIAGTSNELRLQPVSRLPYPKSTIERALQTALPIAKSETMRKQLEDMMLALEDFIPDAEVPPDPEANYQLWRSRKENDRQTAKFFYAAFLQTLIEEFGVDEGRRRFEAAITRARTASGS